VVSPETLARWREAVGRELVEQEDLDPGAAARFDRAVGGDGHGGNPLVHWAFFQPAPADDDIGEDGHPRRGGFLPDITLERRMFASSRIELRRPLAIGEPAVQISLVARVEHKPGRSGDLVFVEVSRTIEQASEVRVREVQTFVYRDRGADVPMPACSTQFAQGQCWQPDAVNLFRFSAATGNAHRIHYDESYTTRVERYPALIVHGPFTAAKLAGLAAGDGELATFSFRAMAPLFLGQPIGLRQGNDGAVEAVRCDGMTAMTARTSYR